MVQFNTKDNEILVKIVFYGPSLSGKTTNLQKLHDLMDTSQRTDLFSVNTMEDRTLFFDLLPMDLGYVYGNSIKLQIYTVPGQVHYDSTRRIVLSGADGVVFVADSDKSKMQENVQSINNLYHNLQANRLNIKEVPLVMQYNKRDLPSAAGIELLNQKLNFRKVPFFQSVALTGEGVLETFLETVKLTVRYIFEKYQLSKSIKNVDSVIEKLENSLLSTSTKVAQTAATKPAQAHAAPELPASPKSGERSRTVLKYAHNVSRDDKDAQDTLLKKAITSNMETARLYSELKKSKDALNQKNHELNALYGQLEKTNADNLKIRRFLESLVNFAGEAIVTYNEHWVIQNWNQAANELFGYQREEILGQHINVLFPQESMGDLNRVIGFVTQGKVVRGFETKLKAKSGQTLQVNITFSPIKNQNNTITAFTAIVRDLSFMSKMNQQIYALQRFEGSAKLMPELFSLVQKRVQLDPNLSYLAATLLNLCGPTTQQVEQTNMNQILNTLYQLLEAILRRKGIGWHSQLFPSLPNIHMNRQEITQSILNLLLNATESLEGRPDGKITVGTHFANNEILLQIIDTGIGMDHNELDKLFEAAPDSRRSMMGIRLNATREIIRRNGGLLRIDSAPGKGTKVTVKFPL